MRWQTDVEEMAWILRRWQANFERVAGCDFESDRLILRG